jgi:hypothetical protein
MDEKRGRGRPSKPDAATAAERMAQVRDRRRRILRDAQVACANETPDELAENISRFAAKWGTSHMSVRRRVLALALREGWISPIKDDKDKGEKPC